MAVLSCEGLTGISLWPEPVRCKQSIALNSCEKGEVEELGGVLVDDPAENL
jgi:hypothetical protein